MLPPPRLMIIMLSIINIVTSKVNLVLHKEVEQSSTISADRSADKATDGSLLTCSETRPGQTEAWITIDLSAQATVDLIGIYFNSNHENRSDLTGYSVYVTKTKDWRNKRPCFQYTEQGPPDVDEAHICHGEGRYLTVARDNSLTQTDDAVMSICELELLGCLYQSFGTNCSKTCNCQYGGCDLYYGQCDNPGCERGWQGESCDQRCEYPRYGKDCAKICHCAIEGCDVETGVCYTPGCIHGWKGSSCNEKITLSEREQDKYVIPVLAGISGVLFMSLILNIVLCCCCMNSKDKTSYSVDT